MLYSLLLESIRLLHLLHSFANDEVPCSLFWCYVSGRTYSFHVFLVALYVKFLPGPAKLADVVLLFFFLVCIRCNRNC